MAALGVRFVRSISPVRAVESRDCRSPQTTLPDLNGVRYPHRLCAGASANSDSSIAYSPCVSIRWQGSVSSKYSFDEWSNPTVDEASALGRPMTSNDSKNEMLVMVLTDLAGICKKLAENSAVPEKLRMEARNFGQEFDSLSPYRGKGTAARHAQGEQLLTKIARFLPEIVEIVEAHPNSKVA